MRMMAGMFIMPRMIIMPFRTMVVVSFRFSLMMLMVAGLIVPFDVLMVVVVGMFHNFLSVSCVL